MSTNEMPCLVLPPLALDDSLTTHASLVAAGGIKRIDSRSEILDANREAGTKQTGLRGNGID